MSNRLIDKNATNDFLDELLETHQVFAPVSREGILGFEPISSTDEVVFGPWNTRQPPKEVFFPRSEVLFTYQEGQVISVTPLEEQRVVLGIRPCDARSAMLMDLVFDAPDCRDPYYVSRRENTVLIGLACNSPLSTCFCTAVGGGPFATDGLDMLWTDLGDRYLVEPVTERGEALIAANSRFREASTEDMVLKAELAARADKVVCGPNAEGLTEKLDGMYEDPFWDALHQKCLGCGVCSYLCPTCHCFDIADEGDGVRGQRVRNWDTCQFTLFTHHASGHNPRPSGKERMRQRVMHKFNYFVKNLGAVACVGCGRCVRECPVNLDIRAVIENVRQVERG